MGGWDELADSRGGDAAVAEPATLPAFVDTGGAAGPSVQGIEKELQDLRAARHTADERISFFSQRGRGRGRGRGGLIDRFPRRESEGDGLDGVRPSLRDRLGPLPPGTGEDSFERRNSSLGPSFERKGRHVPLERYDPHAESQEPLPGSNRGRLASAIVADPVEQGQEPEARQRPADASTPAAKQRNKRLFGALMGTLQQFRDEDQRFKRSRLAQSRADAEQRAERSAAEEQVRLREQRKEDLARARLEEINKRRQLDVQMQAKQHELAVARRIERELALAGWLKTAARPPLLWLPRLHTQDTQLLLEQRATDLDAWRDAQLAKLEADTAQIEARFRPLEPRHRRPPPPRDAPAAADGGGGSDEPMAEEQPQPQLDRYEAAPEDAGLEAAPEAAAEAAQDAADEAADAAMEGEGDGDGLVAGEVTGIRDLLA